MRILIASLLFVSLPAVAGPAPDVKQMHADDCAKARAANRLCVIDMTGEQLDGTKPRGDGFATRVLTYTNHNSLVHIRRDFIEQVLKTAEDL